MYLEGPPVQQGPPDHHCQLQECMLEVAIIVHIQCVGKLLLREYYTLYYCKYNLHSEHNIVRNNMLEVLHVVLLLLYKVAIMDTL